MAKALFFMVNFVVTFCGICARWRKAVINHWNIPLEWNGSMKYWNDYLGMYLTKHQFIHMLLW